MRYRDMERTATRVGREAGHAAASWAFDGNTTLETYRAVLAGLDAGDPAVLDQFSPPNLSGEWADAPVPADIAAACELDMDKADAADTLDELCTLWEDAAHTAFWHEIERTARFHLA